MPDTSPTPAPSTATPGGPAAQPESAEAHALREAEGLRATAERVAAATQALQDRLHETERLLARADLAHAENERQVHTAGAALDETHEGIREAHVHSDHGNRLLGSKTDADTLHAPATPPADPAAGGA